MGYLNFNEAERSITNYILGYYSCARPHQHNNGMSPNEVEKDLLENLLNCGQIYLTTTTRTLRTTGTRTLIKKTGTTGTTGTRTLIKKTIVKKS
jgi:hypothetical protein